MQDLRRVIVFTATLYLHLYLFGNLSETLGLQGYRATGLQDYRATGLQGYRATGLQSYRATGLQGYRATGLQGYSARGGRNTVLYSDTNSTSSRV